MTIGEAKFVTYMAETLHVYAHTPSPLGGLDLKRNYQFTTFVEPKLESEKVIAANTTPLEEENQLQFIEHEIECPRCHDSMELCSDFDSLYYACSECDFYLYTIKRNK